MNMATETFLTTSYTTVDDGYQQNVPALISGRGSRKPAFSDSEVVTLSDERDGAQDLLDNCRRFCVRATRASWIRSAKLPCPKIRGYCC